jgi:hypothetical protein
MKKECVIDILQTCRNGRGRRRGRGRVQKLKGTLNLLTPSKVILSFACWRKEGEERRGS